MENSIYDLFCAQARMLPKVLKCYFLSRFCEKACELAKIGAIIYCVERQDDLPSYNGCTKFVALVEHYKHVYCFYTLAHTIIFDFSEISKNISFLGSMCILYNNIC